MTACYATHLLVVIPYSHAMLCSEVDFSGMSCFAVDAVISQSCHYHIGHPVVLLMLHGSGLLQDLQSGTQNCESSGLARHLLKSCIQSGSYITVYTPGGMGSGGCTGVLLETPW